MISYFFYSRLSVSKSILYVSLGNDFFTVFCGAPVVEALGNCPVPPPLNPALLSGRNRVDLYTICCYLNLAVYADVGQSFLLPAFVHYWNIVLQFGLSIQWA